MARKTMWLLFYAVGVLLVGTSASPGASPTAARIVLLHHSTGEVIWYGGVPEWFTAYNASHGTSHQIAERSFPEEGDNSPFDYWEIWVQHGHEGTFRGSPTLATLTAEYDVVIWKHCFPVSEIEADTGHPDVASATRTQENYKLQYLALRDAMRTFPQTLFVVWTGAVHTQANLAADQALRMRDFVQWVRTVWDVPGDNIVLWDFYQLETEGGLYLRDAYAESPSDSHPNGTFARRVAPDLGQTVVNALGVGPSPLPSAVPTPVPSATAAPSPRPSATTAPQPSTTPPQTSGGGGGGCVTGILPWGAVLLCLPGMLLFRKNP